MKHLSLAILALSCCVYATTAFAQNCDAYFTPTVACNTVKFVPDLMGAGITYHWDFGVNGITTDTSIQPKPMYTYFIADSVGSYSFTVRMIRNEAGCIDTVTKVVNLTILASSLPSASMVSLGLSAPFLYCNASSANPAFTLSVQNTSTNVGSNGTYVVHWGDGLSNTFTTPPPFNTTTHTYALMGLYKIELIAIAQNGCVDSTHYLFFNGREPGAGIGISASANLCCQSTVFFEHPLNISNNPPGTTYTYTVDDGDGSPYIETIEHTNPLGIFDYTFSHGSCDPAYSINGMSPPQQFIVNVVAANLCGVSSSSITTRISCAPEADFSLDSVGCVGDTHCLANLSDTSYYWDPQQQSCFSDVNLYWQISGGDYTVESGSLGVSASFQSGTDSVCVRYITSGVFTVRLILTPSLGSIHRDQDDSYPATTLPKHGNRCVCYPNAGNLSQSG